MIKLSFHDSYEGYSKLHEIEVPDFPYTIPFCQDGREVRLSLSPLEWETARGDIIYFVRNLPHKWLIHGVWRMNMIHDEIGLLSTWEQVHILPRTNKYGIELEITALLTDVKV